MRGGAWCWWVVVGGGDRWCHSLAVLNLNCPSQLRLQSYFPENDTIKDLVNMDREKFYEKELGIRKKANLPPISKMAAIIVSGRNIIDVQQACLKLSRTVPKIDDVDFFGPAPAPLSRLKGRHRLRFLIHEKKGRKIHVLFCI